MKDIRIAAAIFRASDPDIQGNMDRMAVLARNAALRGARIVCFPEMSITGYSTGRDILSVAQTVPGVASERLSRMAREHSLVLLAGMAERDGHDKIFVSHLVAQPDGSVGVYRKIHMAPPEKTVFAQGDDLPIFEADGVRIGIQLCYDAHFPELSTLMAQKGVDVIFMPHASPKGTPEEKYRSWMRHLPARAYDNSLYVIACNQTGVNRNGVSFPGVALVIDPSGNVAAKDVSGEEGLLMADLSTAAIDRVRNHQMRFFFPNRRPGLYEKAR